MYRTPQGERTLRGAERRVFVESLGMIVDYLSTDDYEAGIAVFDDLQRNQKIAVLLGVSKSLLRDNVSPPPLTAISEAAVAMIYRHVQDQVVHEIKQVADRTSESGVFGEEVEDPGPSWRELALDACRESVGIDPLPPTDSSDVEEWSLLIDCLRDLVLWDNDWEMVEQLDLDPDQRQCVNQEMGIEEDYYVCVPPDPNDEVAVRMLTELRYLTPEGRGLEDLPGPEA